MDTNIVISTATAVLDWHNYFSTLANSLLPDFLKITVQLVIIPLIGLGARLFAHKLVKSYFGFLVKWAGQKISRETENFAILRLDLVMQYAQNCWWLKWLSKEDLQRYIEAAVAEWNLEVLSAIGEKP
jgi:acyl carrier protein phosphodiesterase